MRDLSLGPGIWQKLLRPFKRFQDRKWGSSEACFLLYFFLYGILCVVFYRDRILNHDVAGVVVNLISHERFVCANAHRLVQGIPQAIPLVLVKFGAPLNMVCISYSLSLWSVDLLLAAVLWYGFKRRDLTAALIVLNMIYLVRGNYVSYGENYQGALLVLLMLAVAQTECTGRSRLWRLLALSGLALFEVICCNPLFFPLMLLLAIYLFLAGERWRILESAAIALSATTGYAALKLWLLSAYERLSMAKSMDPEQMRKVSKRLYDFAQYLVIEHPLLLCGLALLLLLACANRFRPWPFLFCIIAACGIFAVQQIRLLMPLGNYYYAWYSFFPAYLFIVIPLMDRSWPFRGPRAGAAFLFAAMAAFCAVRGIAYTVEESQFDQRIILNILASRTGLGERVFALSREGMLDDHPSHWHLGAKSNLLSTLEDGPGGTRVLAFEEKGKVYPMLAKWGVEKAILSRYSDMPKEYNREERVVHLNTRAPADDIRALAAKTRLAYSPTPSGKAMGKALVPVRLENRGGKTLSTFSESGHPVLFAYCWEREGAVLKAGLAQRLLVDVENSYTQDLLIPICPKEGARLLVGLMLDGHWMTAFDRNQVNLSQLAGALHEKYYIEVIGNVRYRNAKSPQAFRNETLECYKAMLGPATDTAPARIAFHDRIPVGSGETIVLECVLWADETIGTEGLQAVFSADRGGAAENAKATLPAALGKDPILLQFSQTFRREHPGTSFSLDLTGPRAPMSFYISKPKWIRRDMFSDSRSQSQ